MNDTRIEFNSPADCFEEALPIGNGRLGGMIFGKEYTEYIQLNDDSVWYGGPSERNNVSALENLSHIRELIFAGKIKEAEELCVLALSGTPEVQGHYEPLGSLYIMFGGEQKDASNYYRYLDMADGIVRTSFEIDGIKYSRNYFASYPSNVIVIELSANKPNQLSFQVQLTRGEQTWDFSPYENQVLRRANYNSYIDSMYAKSGNMEIMTATCGGKGAISLCAGVKIIADEGSVRCIGNTVFVENTTSAMLLLTSDTTFRVPNPEDSVITRLQSINKSYEELKSEHISDYQALYNKVKLDIEDKEISRMFNFGRYLLISCSRPGSLPANLQGIWNKDMNPAWGSKYTININTQMNYWMAESTGLSECHMPLFDHISRMVINGRKTATKMYGCRGFMAHHNTDIWGDTAPQDACISATYWVMGAAWLCLHIWDHYQFTQDANFLEQYFDIMCEAADFILDYLVEDDDYLVTCPTLSPENEYILPNGERGVICKGASMDNQIIRELFNAIHQAEGVLNKKAPHSAEMLDAIRRIAPISIGKHGQIMEWNEDYDEVDPGHRHISQLFALYPGTQITSNSPKLMQAAEHTIRRRLANGGGHTGWSRAWIINLWARLLNGDEALKNAKLLISNSTLPNLLDNHPPFQIDGNFGFTSGITEMLLQSHEGYINILPALPTEWKNGSVKGLCARGGYIVNFSWVDGNIDKVTITGKHANNINICYKGQPVNPQLLTVINL